MKPQKAYILRISNPISREYAQLCAHTCDQIGLPWEYFEGCEESPDPSRLVWDDFPLPGLHIGSGMYFKHPGVCATASHMLIWKRIMENKECAVILEHDSLMLHPINLTVPDNVIVALGYKFHNFINYDWKSAGPPKKMQIIPRFSGAHAYCITARTAKTLIDELYTRGVDVAVDNFYFMRVNQPGDITTDVPLAIMLPTPAINWVRKSTIWENPNVLNYDVLEDFSQYYRQ
jgi:hypothetical protein